MNNAGDQMAHEQELNADLAHIQHLEVPGKKGKKKKGLKKKMKDQ